VRNLYRFAVKPDLTFFFNVPLEVALGRILDGRPKLKYYEAGMDMGFDDDIYQSFRIFQGHVYEEYIKMVDEFGFTVLDASRTPEEEQKEMRSLVQKKIDLARYKYEWNVP
jgi:dTMP kinase